MVKAAVKHGDASVRDRAQKLAATSKFPAAFEAIVKKLPAGPVAAVRPAGSAEKLFEAIYAAPDDDTRRAALADLLQERGDARGEFIALQLKEAKGAATAEGIARAAALLKEHRRDWLGTLGRVTYRGALRRGFLAQVELAGAWNATEKAWLQLAADPAWATVEELDRGQLKPQQYSKLVEAGTWPALRAVAVADAAMMDVLDKKELPKLSRLSCRTSGRKSMVELFTRRIRPFIAAHGVKHLDVPYDLRPTVEGDARLLVQLESLELDTMLDEVPKLLKALPGLRVLTCRLAGAVLEVTKGPVVRVLGSPSSFGAGFAEDLAPVLKRIKATRVQTVALGKLAKDLSAAGVNAGAVLAPSGLVAGLKG
jgi:uncharacterized protein (TIGR02996 family)